MFFPFGIFAISFVGRCHFTEHSDGSLLLLSTPAFGSIVANLLLGFCLERIIMLELEETCLQILAAGEPKKVICFHPLLGSSPKACG